MVALYASRFVISAGGLLLAAVLLTGVLASPLLAQNDPFDFGLEPDDDVDLGTAADAPATEEQDAPATVPDDALTTQLRRYAASASHQNLALAIRQAARVRRWEEVDTFLTGLAQRQLGPAELTEVARVIGRPLLSRMRNSGTLGEESLAQVDVLREALRARDVDRERLRRLIPQIASSSVDERLAAYRGLLAGGNAAIAELVAAASQPQDEAPVSRRQIVDVLERMGPEVAKALQHTALYADRQWRAGALDTLARLDREAALGDLVTALHAADATAQERAVAREHLRLEFPSLPPRTEAAAYLREMLRRANHNIVRAADNEQTETIWNIDEDGESLTFTTTTNRLALSREAVDEANRLRRLGVIPSESQAAALMADLGYRWQVNPLFGSQEDAEEVIQAWGPESLSAESLETALELALDSGRLDAAIALLRLIPANAADRLVVSHAGEPTILVHAVTHSEPQVRYEAARAVGRLQVAQRYTGSSDVLDRWLEMTSLTRLPVALLVEPRISAGLRVESLLTSLGYRVVRVGTVAEAVRQVEKGGDIQWLVANTRLSDAPAIELVDRVRRLDFGASIPIIFYGEPVAATEDPRWDAPLVRIDPPASTIPLTSVMEPIQQARQIPPLTAAERFTYALDGVNMLAEVSAADARYDFYDLRSAGAESVMGSSIAGLLEAKLKVLAALGTPSSQVTLATLAGSSSLSHPHRLSAVDAFAESVERFGTRLGRDDVESQYERYNQATDPEVREALSKILDVMERQVDVTTKATTDAEAASSG